MIGALIILYIVNQLELDAFWVALAWLNFVIKTITDGMTFSNIFGEERYR